MNTAILLGRLLKMTTDNTNDDLPPALPASGEGDQKGVEGSAETPVEKAPEAKAPEAKPAKQSAKASAKPAVQKAVVTEAMEAEAEAEESARVWIIVDEPHNAPSSQQYFGLNGKGYLITFGEKVSVPRELLNVLNECIETRSIPQEGGGVVERDVLRFPYRVVG